MITFVRSAYHKEGKGEEAWAHVIKLAAHVNENYEDGNVQVLRSFNGPPNQGHWVQTHKSLAAMEAFSQKLNEDEKWQELGAEGEGLWTDMTDNYYVSVP
jgi:hypothetical protein